MGKLPKHFKTWCTTQMFDLDRHVERGERWLDKRYPIWFLDVNTSTLDMCSPDNCILGQIFGSFTDVLASGFITARQVVRGGFAIHQHKGDRVLFSENFEDFYDQLTGMWRKVTTTRQAQHRECREEPAMRRKGLT